MPAPCCSAGAPMSCAVDTMICLTTAGVGRCPLCALLVGLDDQRGHAGGQRRRLAGPACQLDRAGLPGEVGASAKKRRVRGAQRPVQVTGRDHVDGGARLGEAARAEAADVVVDPALDARRVMPADTRLGVGAVGGGRADRDHVRVGRGRADRVGHPGVAGGDRDGHAGLDRGVVGQLGQVGLAGVRERVGSRTTR